jgi:hypothetical protein
MAFRFRLDEPIEKGFRRIGAEQIERARRQLQANQDAAAEVHEARKCMKRLRALLRLAREGLGEPVFRAENAHFRAIARSLASARDDYVLLETIVKLAAENEGQATSLALTRLKQAVIAQRAEDPAGNADQRAEADAALERAVRRFRRLKFAPDSFATLERGLVRNYRKARERRDIAYAENTDEAFHDWRKCVQAHWRHMALLSRAWPALFEAQIEAARYLSQLLGDDHDLALLRTRLSALPPETLSPGEVREIESLISTRQGALRRAARFQGEVIFAERPKAHGVRVAGIWHGAAAAIQEDASSKEKVPAPTKGARAKITAVVRG